MTTWTSTWISLFCMEGLTVWLPHAGFDDGSIHPTAAPAARHSSSSTQTADDQSSDDLSALTELFAALGPSSAPLSSTNSASHLPAAALERTSSTSSGSSTDSDSSTSGAAQYRSPSLNTNSSASTSTAALAGVQDSSAGAGAAVLSLDACPLADSDLDELISRLSASTAAMPGGTTSSSSTTGSTAAGTCPQAAGRPCLARTSSSDLSSDNSSGSIRTDQDGRTAPPPYPAHTTNSGFEPRWLKQQRQQHCNPDSSQEINASSPLRMQPLAGKVWKPPSTVVDLRSPVKAATATAATQPEAAGPSCSTSAGAQACGTAAVQGAGISMAGGAGWLGRAAWACDSGSESDSSEEEWQQLRQMQRARAGVGAAGVQS